MESRIKDITLSNILSMFDIVPNLITMSINE